MGGDAGGCAEEVPLVRPDLWARVGRSAGLVYEHLDARVRSPEALARLTGKARATVTEACARLAKVGLARAQGEGWVRGEVQPAAVARALGVWAERERRRQRIEEERRAWRARRPPSTTRSCTCR